MNDWWQGLETREQRILILAGVLSVAMLFYALAWIPLVDNRDLKRTHVENSQELLAWITTKSNEVKQLRRAAPAVQKADSKRSLLAIVDSMAKQLGIRSAINRIDLLSFSFN